MRVATLVLTLLLATPGAVAAQESARARAQAAELRSALEADLQAFDEKTLSGEALVARLVEQGEPLLPVVVELLPTRLMVGPRDLVLAQLPAISPTRGEAALVGFLDTELCEGALKALAKVGTASSSARLLRCFENERVTVRMGAADALARIAQRDPSLAERLGVELRAPVEAALLNGAGGLGLEPTLEVLVALEGARTLPELLRCLRTPNLTRTTLGLLIRAKRSDPVWAPANEFAGASASDVRSTLLELLADSGSAKREQTIAVLQALKTWGDHDTIPALLHYAEEREEDALTTKYVLDGLRGITGRKLEALAECRLFWADIEPIWSEYEQLLAVVESGNARDLELALAKLSKVNDPRTFSAIEQFLADAVWAAPVVQKAAVVACQSLAELGSRHGAGSLIGVLANSDAPPVVKRKATWALGIIAGGAGPQDVAHWDRVFPGARTKPEVAAADGETSEGTEGTDQPPAPPPAPRRSVPVGPSRPDGEEEVPGGEE